MCNLRHSHICKFYRDIEEILGKIQDLSEKIKEKDDLIDDLVEKMKMLEKNMIEKVSCVEVTSNELQNYGKATLLQQL